MKELKDFENEIYKCSRCGLCQSVCPVYKATLNECAVSRGKFNILNGIVKKELNLTKQVKKYLDLCTGCNACRDFCPSQINAKEIFITAKAEYHKKHKPTSWERLINSYTLFKTLLICGKVFFLVYRCLLLDKLVSPIAKLIANKCTLGKRVLLLNTLATKTKTKRTKSTTIKNKTAIYFEGCFNQYLNSETKDAVENILANSDIKVINKNFECCGVSYLNDGNIKEYKKLINKNLEKLNCQYDYLITDCASCNEILKNYRIYSSNETAKELSKKVVSVIEIIKGLKFKANTNLKVSIHKPCHEDTDFRDLVKNIKNINFVDVEDYNKCCGFSGKFALQNSEISRKISQNKAQKYIDCDTDIILTTCPACQLGLNQGLAETNCNKKTMVMNLFVFLNTYCEQI